MDVHNFSVENDIICKDSQKNVFRVIFLVQGKAQVKIDFTSFSFQGPTLVFTSENQLLSIESATDDLQGIIVNFSNDFFCIKLNRSETSYNFV